MKKLLALTLFAAAMAHAAGTVQQSGQQIGTSGNYFVTFYWTGDAVTGSVPVTAAQLPFGSVQGYRILQVETVPGSPAPTSGYSVQIVDSFSGDMMGGALSSLSASSVQFFSATSATPPINGTFSLSITGQSVPGAMGKVIVYYGPTTLVNATAGSPGPQGPTGPAGPAGPTGGTQASSFNFAAQTPGGTLSAGIAATVTMTPCPSGVNGTDAGHYYYISGGVGTAEDVVGTGGTCTSGATTGTLIFTPGNNHSGAWTIASSTAGIREAESTLPNGGLIQGPTGISTIGPLALNTNGITLYLQGELDLRNGSSITMTGTQIGIIGNGYRLIKALSTTGDIITLTGCTKCTLQRIYMDRVGTAISGAGVNVASGVNSYFTASDLQIYRQYRGIWAQVSPVLSRWAGITTNNNVTQGMEFVNMNDESVTDFWSENNGGYGVRVGPGTNAVGSMKFANGVVYNNTSDGFHIEGVNTTNPVVFVMISNTIADTDGGYELYVKNATATTVTNCIFNNGFGLNSVRLDSGVSGFTAAGMSAGGAKQEGLYITGTATSITLAGLVVTNSGTQTPGTYYGVRINGQASHISIVGGQIGNVSTTNEAGGIAIDNVTGGTPFDISVTGVDFVGLTPATYISRSAGLPVVGANAITAALNFNGSANSSTGTQSIPNITWTSVLLDTNVFDSGSIHSTVTNTSRFTVPAGGDGLYLAACNVSFAANATGVRYVRILKNGAGTVLVTSNTTIVGSTDAAYLSASAYAQLAGTDYVECQVYQSSGGALAMGGQAAGILAKIW